MQTVSLLFVLVKSIFAVTVRPTQGFASLRPKPVTLAPFMTLGRWDCPFDMIGILRGYSLPALRFCAAAATTEFFRARLPQYLR